MSSPDNINLKNRFYQLFGISQQRVINILLIVYLFHHDLDQDMMTYIVIIVVFTFVSQTCLENQKGF